MTILAIYLAIVGAFNAHDLHQSIKQSQRLQEINDATVKACGEAWLGVRP